jgi:hypothetical protein
VNGLYDEWWFSVETLTPNDDFYHLSHNVDFTDPEHKSLFPLQAQEIMLNSANSSLHETNYLRGIAMQT